MLEGSVFVSQSGQRYYFDENGVPKFAEHSCSEEADIQQQHYDKVSSAYIENLNYPHTQEYLNYLDKVLIEEVGESSLGLTAEICCGNGESFQLFRQQMSIGIGVDISLNMLASALDRYSFENLFFIQGDATRLPIKDDSFDTVIMLGGIHHVPDRDALFSEVNRILKSGGRFIWREPVNDFWLWRFLREIIYWLSPMLDNETERPLLYKETESVLCKTGFSLQRWETCGFLGFCIFMNSDVLFFNRFFRYIPGIRVISRLAAKIDEWLLHLPGLQRAGLQVVGIAINKN